MTAFGSTGIGDFSAVSRGLTPNQLSAIYLAVCVILAVAVVVWFMVCVDVPGWLAAAMFSLTVAVVAETMFRKGDVTQNDVDIALSVFIFVILLAALWEGQKILIFAVGAFVMFLATHWSSNLAIRILVPMAIGVGLLLLLHYLTRNIWQVFYQVLLSFSCTWVIVYALLFIVNNGSMDHIDYSSHDLLEGPNCFTEHDCALRLSSVLFGVALRMVCVIINKTKLYCDCAFCWNDHDVEEEEQKAKLLQQSATVAVMVQRQMEQKVAEQPQTSVSPETTNGQT